MVGGSGKTKTLLPRARRGVNLGTVTMGGPSGLGPDLRLVIDGRDGRPCDRGDCQAQAGAAESARDGAVGLLEAPEQPADRAGGDADAGVDHREAQDVLARLATGRFDAQDDAAGVGELDGVVEQIEQLLR